MGLHRPTGVHDMGIYKYRPFRALPSKTCLQQQFNPLGVNNFLLPNKPHSFEVIKIELLDDSNSPVSVASHPNSKRGLITNTTKLLQNVEKSYDKGKFLLDESENQWYYCFEFNPASTFFVGADLFLIFFTTFALALGAPKSYR